eukprot:1710342-Rhodomonas_salina.1
MLVQDPCSTKTLAPRRSRPCLSARFSWQPTLGFLQQPTLSQDKRLCLLSVPVCLSVSVPPPSRPGRSPASARSAHTRWYKHAVGQYQTDPRGYVGSYA